MAKPNIEGHETVRKEATRDVLVWICKTPITLQDWFAICIVSEQEVWKLCDACIYRKVPRCPHQVGVSWRECRRHVWGTMVVLYDMLR